MNGFKISPVYYSLYTFLTHQIIYFIIDSFDLVNFAMQSLVLTSAKQFSESSLTDTLTPKSNNDNPITDV